MAGSDKFNQESNYDGPGEITPGGRYGSAMWIDKNDNLWIFGGWKISGLNFCFKITSGTSHVNMNDLWCYSPEDDKPSNASKDSSWISVLVGAIVGVVLFIPTNSS